MAALDSPEIGIADVARRRRRSEEIYKAVAQKIGTQPK
jgi:hypothetical protein